MLEINISDNKINSEKLREWINQYEWSDMTGYFVMNEMTYMAIINDPHYNSTKIFQFPILRGKYVAFCNAIPFGKIEFATTSDR